MSLNLTECDREFKTILAVDKFMFGEMLLGLCENRVRG